MRHEAWELDDVLDGIDGVAYAVDLRYRILAVGRTRWNEFAAGNGALELTAASVLGQNLFDIIQGDDVREVYRRYTDETIATSRPIALALRCDSPGVRRELRLAITPLRSAGVLRGVHFQSLAVDELVRPPIDLFDFKTLMAVVGGQHHSPIVTLCSFCQRVNRAASGAEPVWIDAEEYYRSGGTSNVRISHGLCSDCLDKHYGI